MKQKIDTAKFSNFMNHNIFSSHLNTCAFVNIICSHNSSQIKHEMVFSHLWDIILIVKK